MNYHAPLRVVSNALPSEIISYSTNCMVLAKYMNMAEGKKCRETQCTFDRGLATNQWEMGHIFIFINCFNNVARAIETNRAIEYERTRELAGGTEDAQEKTWEMSSAGKYASSERRNNHKNRARCGTTKTWLIHLTGRERAVRAL